MRNKPLIQTNPHLRDPEKFRKTLTVNVASSTAVETGTAIETIARDLNEGSKAKPAKKRRASAR